MSPTIPKHLGLIAATGLPVTLSALLTGCSIAPEPIPFTQAIGTTGLKIQMLPVPSGDGTDTFWMARTEVDWDTFDAFVFDVDELPVKGTLEAETRPTRPYMLVDRGFGHAGYPGDLHVQARRRGLLHVAE